MAQFSVEINDADVSRVLDAISANYNRIFNIYSPLKKEPNVGMRKSFI